MSGAPSNIKDLAFFSRAVPASFIVTDEKPADGYYHGRIDKKFLQEQLPDFRHPFYICGPDAMVKELTDTLSSLGATPESVVFEK